MQSPLSLLTPILGGREFCSCFTLKCLPQSNELGEQGKVWGAEAPDALYTGCLPSHWGRGFCQASLLGH